MSDDKNELERWIEDGVRRYVEAEPPLGMTERVLTQLEERRSPRRWWRPWMIAAAVAALLAMVVGLSLQPKTRPQPAAPPQVAKTDTGTPPQPSIGLGAQSSPQVEAHLAQRQAPARARRLPREDALTGVSSGVSRPQQFPSPVAATEQERLLSRLVQDRAAARTVAAKAAETQEIVISRIAIAPVEIPLLPDPNPGE